MYYDPEFFTYLKMHAADDLLFCYRWLLLEMKREFAFDSALRVLEVAWASLPPATADTMVELWETRFSPCVVSPASCVELLAAKPCETAYGKVRFNKYIFIRKIFNTVSIKYLGAGAEEADHVLRHHQLQRHRGEEEGQGQVGDLRREEEAQPQAV